MSQRVMAYCGLSPLGDEGKAKASLKGRTPRRKAGHAVGNSPEARGATPDQGEGRRKAAGGPNRLVVQRHRMSWGLE